MKIVKFKNGKYGIRRRSLLCPWKFIFKDLVSCHRYRQYWWDIYNIQTENFKNDCQSKDLAHVKEVFNNLKRKPEKDLGKPIEIDE